MNLGEIIVSDEMMRTALAFANMVKVTMPRGKIESWPTQMAAIACVACLQDMKHLEIGVLHGGTAIPVAMLKRALNQESKVVMIDPLDGYYPGSIVTERGKLLTQPVEPITQTPVSPGVLWDNFGYYGLWEWMTLVQAFSDPWPDVLEDAIFGSVLIDGNHYYEAPLKDWQNVKDRVAPGGYVMFDDCNYNCPGVQAACKAAAEEPGWTFQAHLNVSLFIVRRDGR